MSKIVFRNYDKKAIRNLLREIGKERYQYAIDDADFISPPLSMEGFFVEYEPWSGNIELYFRFPMCQPQHIMSVLGYWAVTKEGWQMLRKE